MVGRKIANYAIKRVIGEGGLGSVYEAVQEPSGRRVAIKILRPEYAQQPNLVKRFFTEARATNQIAHPSIVQISDYGQLDDRTPYLVMELLAGQSLSDYSETTGGKLPESLAQHLIWQLASVLTAAHARDLIHRDLKPNNIMLVADPVMPCGLRVKLLDFGTAKLGTAVSRPTKQTRSGLVMGTPLYMAPEQCLGSPTLTAKVDVYALGVLFFEMLAGQPPFTAETDLVVLNMHVTKPPPVLQDYLPTVSAATASLVAKMLEKDPQQRPTMAEVTQQLQRLGSSMSREQDTVLVPKQRRAPVAAVEDNNSNKTEWIRRPAKIRQPMPVQRRRRVWAASALVLFAGGWMTFGAVRWRHQEPAVTSEPVLAPLPAEKPGGVPTPAALRVAPPVAPPAVPPMVPPAAPSAALPAPVLISIKSIPDGATVIDLEGDKKLGVTPFSVSLDAHDKDLWLILRKEGFGDRVMRVNLRHSSEWSEKLAHEPGPTHRPATRQSIEDLKKKYNSREPADASKPRIVD